VDSAAAAAALLQPGCLRAYAAPAGRFASREAAQAWLDAERTNLVAAVRQYAHEGPAWAAWQLADGVGADLAKRSQLIDLEAVATAARQAADGAGSEVGHAIAELNFGRSGWVVAAYADAQKHFAAAAEAAAQQWPEGVAEAYRGLGNVALEAGQLSEAAEHYERALSLVDVAAAPAFHGSLSNNLGLVAAHQGRLDVAAERFEAVLRWARELGSIATLGQVLSNLGEAYRNIGRYADAIPLVEEAVQLHRRSGHLGAEVICLVQLAYAELDGGHGEAAWTVVETAEQRVALIEEPVLTAAVQNAKGQAAANLGRYAEAQRCHEEAMATALSLGNNELELNAGLGLARLALWQGRYSDADARAEATADRAVAVDHGQYRVDCLLVRAEARRLGGPAVFGPSAAAQAEDLARRALADARRSGLLKLTATALTILGHLADGAAAWREAYAIYLELQSPRAGELAALLAADGNGAATDRS
jgi:tetratricopeptide (TPR) repeat protein